MAAAQAVAGAVDVMAEVAEAAEVEVVKEATLEGVGVATVVMVAVELAVQSGEGVMAMEQT
eukprot:2543497-Prymnesium_polylepis.1